MTILGIESSCDETAAAIVQDGVHEVCSVVASSKELHHITGGIVPEIAARKQVEFIVPVIEQCMEKYGKSYEEIDAIGVTVGPGLVGSLIVGVEAAKALSLAWNKPLIPVNHLVGHLYANFIDNTKEVIFPAIGLLVSGGHTDLILIKGHGDFEFIGGTLDDAAGECFDKTARLLGISKYLGGRLLSEKGAECKENTIKGRLPRPVLNQDNFDFSFSGLKTAVKRMIQNEEIPLDVLCREFEDAAVDVLVGKTIRALKQYDIKTLLMGGGVSANKVLRERLSEECKSANVDFHVPPIVMCTDNAVYVAGSAYFNNKVKLIEEVNPNPSLGIMDLA